MGWEGRAGKKGQSKTAPHHVMLLCSSLSSLSPMTTTLQRFPVSVCYCLHLPEVAPIA